jgi:hypothetical protein
MAPHGRDEEKRRRRKKRLEKRRARQRPPAEPAPSFDKFLADLEHHLRVPPPERWPGGCDANLARPDLVKLNLAEFATGQPPGRDKCRQLEDGFRKGLLHFLPELDHWSWEEFIYHGLPGDLWHPIEAYLAQAAGRYPPAAAEQLRRWKEARIGLFEVGEVADDTLSLREWDAVLEAPAGPWVRAITLNIGGVNLLRGDQGKILFTYLAPWVPEADLYCGMGYSKSADKRTAVYLLPYLGLRHPDAASRPLPWNESRAAGERCLRAWRGRDWHGWLRDQLTFPFPAFVTTPPKGEQRVLDVFGLLPSTTEQARHFGVYFEVPLKGGGGVLAAGATHVVPLDVTSRNRLALAEYHAYRDRAGPPPASRAAPPFQKL